MRIIKTLALIVVSSFLVACGDDGGNFASISIGDKTFTANGGAADDLGGNGGQIHIDVLGDVSVSRTGTVDTRFVMPSYDFNFGSNKATVSADTTVLIDPVSLPAAGGLFLFSGQPYLFISNGMTGAAVSGLEVKKGATLTIPANDGTWARVVVSQSVVVDGTIKTAAEGNNLAIEAGSMFQIGMKGLVTTRSSTIGTDSGDIYLYSQSVFINSGTIDSSGVVSSFTSGGNAGYIEINAESFAYITGTLLAVGGNSTAPELGNGGNGGWIGVYSFSASVYISGGLDCSGGDGVYGGLAGVFIPGEGEYASGGIDISAGIRDDVGSVGQIIAGGTITANGGNGSSFGLGGDAGHVSMDSNGGKVWTSATIAARGGNDGGRGGDFRIFADYGTFDLSTVENRGIKITGNIDLSGGYSGGYAGTLDVRNNVAGVNCSIFPKVEMLGYKSINMNGGAAYGGGQGGQFLIYTRDLYAAAGFVLPVGSIKNNVPISLQGGRSDNASNVGGLGGSLRFVTGIEFGHDGEVVVENGAAIDISGGGFNNSRPNNVLLFGSNKVVNSGTITAHSGPEVVTIVTLLSAYDVLNTGKIDASGVFGNFLGGDGGIVDMYAGNQVKNRGAITTNGGDSNEYGGNGGWIRLSSERAPTSNNGVLKAGGGKGGITNGQPGLIRIDFVDIL